MRKVIGLLICYLLAGNASALPRNFVYLHDVDPSILQEMRYASSYNFVGRPIAGYQASSCILTRSAAIALAKVQQELKRRGLSLKVLDCYRPTRAVADFWQWSQQSSNQSMKKLFYPRFKKVDLFKYEYIAQYSGHSRGSTVDLTLVSFQSPTLPAYAGNHHSCISSKRYKESDIDMGTNFDCLDSLSHVHNHAISISAYKNRQILRQHMLQQGFVPYEREWWHFTLKREPYTHTYFNFIVR